MMRRGYQKLAGGKEDKPRNLGVSPIETLIRCKRCNAAGCICHHSCGFGRRRINPHESFFRQASSSSNSLHKDASGCFIATAAFGSRLSPEVQSLRSVRDRHLLTNGLGRSAVDAYYAMSPPLSRQLSKSSLLRGCVRRLIAVHIMRPIKAAKRKGIGASGP